VAFAAAATLALLLPDVLRAATPRVHAIVGARIVTAPGQVIERGTIVMRDGLIVAVGANVPVPADARVWPGDSLTVYPGLIDAFVMPAEPASGPPPGGTPGTPPGRPQPPPAAPHGATHELAAVHPEIRMIEAPPLSKDQLEALRAAGFAVAQLAPRRGILRGSTAVIGLGDAAANAAVVKSDAAQVVALETAAPGAYPGSLMGAIAVIRQVFMDAKWYAEVQATYARAPQGKERPQVNAAWEALQPVIRGEQPALFVADEMLEVLRAARIAREAGVPATIVTGGDEYKRVREVAADGMPLVVPVNFPEPPELSDPDLAPEVTTEELRQWQDAPGNAAALAKAGVSFALTANGLKDVKQFRANVAKAIARGLRESDALAAVTTAPAKLLGLESRLGTLAPGKIASLTVTHGDLFSEKGKVREVWVDGERFEAFERDERGIKGTWSIGWGHARHALLVRAEKDTSVRLALGADTLTAREFELAGDRLRFTVQRGDDPAERFDLAAKGDFASGTLSVAGVGSHDVTGWRQPDPEEKGREAPKPKDEPVASPAVMGNSEPWRMPAPAQPSALLVRNATIWTAGPQGTLQNADLLVKNRKIAGVGKNLSAPAGAVVIDGAGKHIAPGIIDEHSHSAILGNVNECTHSVTCEVRIQDVINSENVNIYRQLAGGTTMMHLLHGSCNAIGGQCAVIKNKWGKPPDALLFGAAPPTVKFALGENPKQSNFGAQRADPPRYPQSRAGVEQTIRDAFTRARDDRAAWAEYRAHRRPYPPRRDLQLEAVAEILDGRRYIHCHSYRQDEVLMLMRLAEQFGVRVNTFTHILEGYKVADEIATHGASALGFTDWWAYKFEVIDAIPYNMYLMWDRGVNVGFNSDSDELARRLNTEAAKAVKYGGVPPEEAIKFVTINPARSLLIDARVGSLEVGKDADFSIWNGSPLSPYSLCEQTWIEGRKYFDRAEDLAGREALAKERAALIAKARAAKKEEGPGRGGRRGNWPPRYLDDTDLSGNDCGAGDHEIRFIGETERRAIQRGTRDSGSEGVQR